MDHPDPDSTKPADHLEEPVDFRVVSEAVGSSMTTMRAAPMALAISTICCSGMLSVSTVRAGSMADPTLARRSAAAPVTPGQSTFCQQAAFERQRDVLGHGQMREQGRLLVDGGDAERMRRGGVHVRHVPAGHTQVPASGRSAPVMILISVDFPAPFSRPGHALLPAAGRTTPP